MSKLIKHQQWQIISGALDRYTAGERDADYTLGIIDYGFRILSQAKDELCDDCPPKGYPTDKTRCKTCPRRPDPHADQLARDVVRDMGRGV